MDKLEFQKNEFKNLSDIEKKLQLGKLQVLETIVEMLNCMRESITRELYVNGVEEESDITEEKKKEIKDLSDVD